jgi:hypothetical protein
MKSDTHVNEPVTMYIELEEKHLPILEEGANKHGVTVEEFLSKILEDFAKGRLSGRCEKEAQNGTQ